MTKLKEIWIEAEEWELGWNPLNVNTDVIVTFDNGDEYCATFFTYSNISKLSKKNHKTGELLNGKYFWASGMILIDKCSRQDIEQVIEDLICDERLPHVFIKN